MNIIVCIKQVPGTSEVEIDEKTGVLKRSGVDSKMNPYDLYALETALRIREKEGGTVKVISMGPPQAEQVIREAYMMGADDGVLLTDQKFAGADVLATAYTLSQGIKKMGDFHLLICGKMSTDGDTAQVGPEVAEFLNIPHVSNVRKILSVYDEEVITVEMDMSETVEIQEVLFPCLITVEKDIYTPRLPSFKLKLRTMDKKVHRFGLKDLEDQNRYHYGLNGSPTQVLKVFPPPKKDVNEVWRGSGDELGKRLAEKLKELKFIQE
ncbi:MAG: electron transfer flavoprotein subunit beta/FixA family protein [Candidatus Marinimicrobia bacterium]|nr:electron transfer flavoprotein subunit beta/FixA family protein [Candidatus Neomarinimicrobiota bacterium]